jgi:hypothetical protein
LRRKTRKEDNEAEIELKGKKISSAQGIIVG